MNKLIIDNSDFSKHDLGVVAIFDELDEHLSLQELLQEQPVFQITPIHYVFLQPRNIDRSIRVAMLNSSHYWGKRQIVKHR